MGNKDYYSFRYTRTLRKIIDWKILPHHLLDEILKRVESRVDYIHFGAVSASWRSAWELNIVKLNSLSRHHHPPMLMIPLSTGKKGWGLYDVATNKFIFRKLHTKLIGSSNGWLSYLNEDESVTLHQPFSTTNKNHKITLPKLPQVSLIFKILITADPVENRNECVVMLVNPFALTFIRLGKDSSWTKLTGHDFKHIDDVVIVGGNKVYAVKNWLMPEKEGSMISFEICDNSTTAVEEVAPMIPPLTKFYWGSGCNRYLVRSPCSEDLLQVERYKDSFRIFRFGGKNKGWIRVTKLENMCLFVGESSSISVLCSLSNGYKSNYVYFTPYADNEPGRYSYLGTYDLGANEVKLHTSLNIATKDSPIWVVPTVLN